jgi:hypothetical protein
MNYLNALVTILAALTGAAGGCLLTIVYYHRLAKERADYEEELARAQDILVGLALLHRMRARRHRPPCHPEQPSDPWRR